MKSYFIHIPKTAGTSIRTVLFAHPEFDCSVAGYVGPKIPLTEEVSRRFTKEKHPRKETIYRWYPHIEDSFVWTFVRNPWSAVVSLWIYKKQRDSINVTFEEFALGTDLTYLAASSYFDLEKLDFIGKFENLEQDFKKLCKILRWSHNTLPVTKKIANYDYKEYHTKRTKDIVKKAFVKEIEWFNYEF